MDLSREHPEPPWSVAPAGLERPSPLLLDLQRVVHAAAFRRLQYKTQVFVAAEDHFRTRLTHTLEVAQLARTLARDRGADADLAEVAALAHDLGHPPFGHAGERALNAALAAHGGFEHNAQSLRVVEYLEHPYPEFRGLNLTRVVRECLAKHTTRFDQPGAHPLQDGRPPPVEGLLVGLADRLTCLLHDLQDGLYAGLFRVEHLDEVPLSREVYQGPRGEAARWRGHLRPATDRLRLRLRADLPAPPAPRLSAEVAAQVEELERFLMTRVYRNARVRRMDALAERLLSELFTALCAAPAELPRRFAARVGAQPLERVVADYVAGMTDRFARKEHTRLGR